MAGGSDATPPEGSRPTEGSQPSEDARPQEDSRPPEASQPSESSQPAQPERVELQKPKRRETSIQTRKLTKKYGDFTAVDRLDLRVDRGEIFGLLGPNGAGKTTTILMLLGLSEPTDGEAVVGGLDPVRQPLDVKRIVGYLPDNVGFYGDLSGRENLRYTAGLNRLRRGDAEMKIDDLLTQVGLADVADKDVSTYSRGMRQRLGIADALVKDPQILILDEPTIGLDPEGAQEALELIRRLAADREVTVLLSSHLLYQVQAICDRVAIFVSGRIVAQGRVSDLADQLPSRVVDVEIAAPDDADVAAIVAPNTVRREGDVWVLSSPRDTRKEVAGAFLRAGVPLMHLRRRGTDLDEVYRRWFQQDQMAEAARSDD